MLNIPVHSCTYQMLLFCVVGRQIELNAAKCLVWLPLNPTAAHPRATCGCRLHSGVTPSLLRMYVFRCFYPVWAVMVASLEDMCGVHHELEQTMLALYKEVEEYHQTQKERQKAEVRTELHLTSTILALVGGLSQ